MTGFNATERKLSKGMVPRWEKMFREAFKQKPEDDEDVVKGNRKVRWLVGSDHWFSNCVPQRCLRKSRQKQLRA